MFSRELFVVFKPLGKGSEFHGLAIIDTSAD